MTKAGIDKIAGKRTLRMLKLGGPAIDDETIGLVAGMSKLTGLVRRELRRYRCGRGPDRPVVAGETDLYQCPKVTDKGLEILTNCTNLRQLSLRDTGVKGGRVGQVAPSAEAAQAKPGRPRMTDAEAPAWRS